MHRFAHYIELSTEPCNYLKYESHKKIAAAVNEILYYNFDRYVKENIDKFNKLYQPEAIKHK